MYIAKQDDNPFTIEDTLKWGEDRLTLHMITNNVHAEWKQEQQEKAEEEAKYGEKPEDFPQEDWDLLEGGVKKKVAEGDINPTSLELHLEKLREQKENNG